MKESNPSPMSHLGQELTCIMNRANQQQLFQATNQGLLGIRQLEINYYQGLNVAFGTQAALIGGFTYGVFSLNIINHGNGYRYLGTLVDLCWTSSAVTIALSIHVILCTMLMQVLGPGLALNGPVGSMTRATEGMRLELKQIIISFVAMMIFFSISTVLSCWMVMSFEGAVGCTLAFVAAAYYWYYYCERIYLRFYWEREEAGWNPRESIDSNDEPHEQQITQSNRTDAEDHRVRTPKKKGLFGYLRSMISFNITQPEEDERTHRLSNGHMTTTGAQMHDPHSNMEEDERTHRLSNGHMTTTGAQMHDPHSNMFLSLPEIPPTGQQQYLQQPPQPHMTQFVSRGVVLEGYLTKRGGTSQKVIDFRTEPWERRYFTLSATCNLFIYKNRHEYRTDPKKPIYTRPLRLQDYYVEVFNMNNPNASGGIVEDDPANPYRFQMTLVLRENVDNPTLSHMPITATADGVAVNPLFQARTMSCNSITTSTRTGTTTTAAAKATVTALRQAMYRDHWVLQCDTEEELLLWLHTIRTLCPTCFQDGTGV